MPASRIPHDHYLTSWPDQSKMDKITGQTLWGKKIGKGAPTGTPDASFYFDETNGIMYSGTSGSWVAQSPGGAGGTQGATNFVTDTLTINSQIVVPTLHVFMRMHGNEATTVPAALFVADRAYRLVSGKVHVILGTGGITTVTVFKTQSGTALGSGTAMTDGIGLAAGAANTTLSYTPVATAGAFSLAAGDIMGIVGSGGTPNQMTSSSNASIDLILRPI